MTSGESTFVLDTQGYGAADVQPSLLSNCCQRWSLRSAIGAGRRYFRYVRRILSLKNGAGRLTEHAAGIGGVGAVQILIEAAVGELSRQCQVPDRRPGRTVINRSNQEPKTCYAQSPPRS